MLFLQEVKRPVWLNDWQSHISLIERYSPHNWGCAGARQRMVDYVISRFDPDDILVFLDDDVMINHSGWLSKLIHPLVNGYDIAGVDARRILDGWSEECPPEFMTYTSGGRCAISAQVFAAGCEFDPRYMPNYFEDADLCYQAIRKGFKIACVGDIGLEHRAGSIFPNIVLAQNRTRFLEKWGEG